MARPGWTALAARPALHKWEHGLQASRAENGVSSDTRDETRARGRRARRVSPSRALIAASGDPADAPEPPEIASPNLRVRTYSSRCIVAQDDQLAMHWHMDLSTLLTPGWLPCFFKAQHSWLPIALWSRMKVNSRGVRFGVTSRFTRRRRRPWP